MSRTVIYESRQHHDHEKSIENKVMTNENELNVV